MATQSLVPGQISEFDRGKAKYICIECGARRQYGNASPSEPSYRPLINCADCQKPTRHYYVAVERLN